MTDKDTPHSYDVVGLGLATLDVLVRLEDMPAWDAGTRLNAVRMDGGGPVATALVAAERLGVRTAFFGTAGGDDLADIKVRSLADEGVNLDNLQRYDGPERQVVVVFVRQSTGERVFAPLRDIHTDELRPQGIDRESITSARCLHLDGFSPGAARQAARWMKEAGKPVVFDGGQSAGEVSDGKRRLLEYVDILISGAGFAPAVTGRQDVWEAGIAALDAGPRVVVQTVGEDGACVTTPEGRFHVPAFPVEVTDTTGAGDVFHGAWIAAMLRGWDVHATAVFASAVAALACRHIGGRAGIPTFDEAVRLAGHHGYQLPEH